MAADSWGLAGRLFWLRLGDQVAVAHGVVVDGELETRNPQANAATPDNRDSGHRSGTRLGPRPSTSGTARQHEEHPPAQATPVKWIGQSTLMGAQDAYHGSQTS